MNGRTQPDNSPSGAGPSTTADKLSQILLVVLEAVVFGLWMALRVVDLSFLDIYIYWVAMMFFWLVVLLFVASLRMFSKHRLLAMIGLGLVALIVVPALIPPTLFSGRR